MNFVEAMTAAQAGIGLWCITIGNDKTWAVDDNDMYADYGDTLTQLVKKTIEGVAVRALTGETK